MEQKKIMLAISGMDCQGCADTIARALKREKGVLKVAISLKVGKGEVVFDPQLTSSERILGHRVFQGHYTARLAPEAE